MFDNKNFKECFRPIGGCLVTNKHKQNFLIFHVEHESVIKNGSSHFKSRFGPKVSLESKI